MILSMTGFGRGTAVRNGREITVELRSVNSRYFEYSSRIPRTCSYLDSRLKKQLNERITRGKVELSMTIQNVDAADTVVTVNMELARSYQQAMRDLSEQLGVKNDISAAVLTRFPDVLAFFRFVSLCIVWTIENNRKVYRRRIELMFELNQINIPNNC